MLSWAWKVIKTGCFAILILVVGNLIHWDGESLSSHVRVQTSVVRDSAVVHDVQAKVQDFVDKISANFKKSVTDRVQVRASAPRKNESPDRVGASDRQELNAVLGGK